MLFRSGRYEVVHYTQLLNRLVREGRLRLAPPQAAGGSMALDVPSVSATPATLTPTSEEGGAPAADAPLTSTETAEPQSAPPAAASDRQAASKAASEPVIPTVTYHDACYLGRHNQVYSPPRELLEATGATGRMCRATSRQTRSLCRVLQRSRWASSRTNCTPACSCW